VTFFVSFTWKEISLWPVLVVREMPCNGCPKTHLELALCCWGGEIGVFFG
jgi:hypothetical protein